MRDFVKEIQDVAKIEGGDNKIIAVREIQLAFAERAEKIRKENKIKAGCSNL